jgi:uncharacterized membrane protein YfcA
MVEILLENVDYFALLLILVSFFTAIISATLSMAGGTILLSFMSMVMPIATLIPVHGSVQLVSNFWRCFLLRKEIKRDWFQYFCVGSILGTVLATIVLQQFFNLEYASILIAVMIFYTLFKPKNMPSIKIQKWGFFFVGILIGFGSMFLGATGLILGVFFATSGQKKNVIVATQASMQTFNHALKVLGYLYLGFNFFPWLVLMIFMMLATLAGTTYGVKLLQRVPEDVFMKIYKVVLFVSGIKLLWDFAKLFIRGS